MIDKAFCMSSYLALKFLVKDNVDFFPGMKHLNWVPIPDNEKIKVYSAQQISKEIDKQVSAYKGKKVGVFLSGGMDSAIVASFFPGCDAYTFRYNGINYPEDEIKRAVNFAKHYNLRLHYVDIDFDSMLENLDLLMINKSSPVYYIEPQLAQAAIQAREDGMEIIMVGEGSDIIFGGLNWLLAKDWNIDEFRDMYKSMNPERILCESSSVDYLFEQYRLMDNRIDYMRFINTVFAIEAYTAYENAFKTAGIPYYDPFERLSMGDELDISRVRQGEPKYLIRELFAMRYPNLPIPEKIRLPNPLDAYMRGWPGPKRHEFLKNLDVSCLKGKQKWHLFFLERFLNIFEH